MLEQDAEAVMQEEEEEGVLKEGEGEEVQEERESEEMQNEGEAGPAETEAADDEDAAAPANEETGAEIEEEAPVFPSNWRALLEESDDVLRRQLKALHRISLARDEADPPSTEPLPLEFPTLKVHDGKMDLPRRAMSGWSYFIADKHGSRPSKEAGDEWKALSEDAKEVLHTPSSVSV